MEAALREAWGPQIRWAEDFLWVFGVPLPGILSPLFL